MCCIGTEGKSHASTAKRNDMCSISTSGSSAGLQLLAIPEQCICTYMITFTHTHTQTIDYVHLDIRSHTNSSNKNILGKHWIMYTSTCSSCHGASSSSWASPWRKHTNRQTHTHTHTWIHLMTDTQPNTHLYDYHNICICALDFKMQGALLLAQPQQLLFFT